MGLVITEANATLTPFGTNLSTGHLYSFKYSKISQKSVTDLGADLMCLRLPIQRSLSGAWGLRLPFKDTQTSLPHVLLSAFRYVPVGHIWKFDLDFERENNF